MVIYIDNELLKIRNSKNLSLLLSSCKEYSSLKIITSPEEYCKIFNIISSIREKTLPFNCLGDKNKKFACIPIEHLKITIHIQNFKE